MIHYRNDVRQSGIDGKALRVAARALLAATGNEGASLSLWIVDDETMRALNRKHRGKDQPTDVLSFPQRASPAVVPLRLARASPATARPPRARPAAPGKRVSKPEIPIGDIVISAETAKRQAAEYDAPVQLEVERLLIHGVAHLLGHDHRRPAERKKMRREERRLADSIGMPWPY